MENFEGYRDNLAKDLKSEPDHAKRREMLDSEKNSIRYQEAEERHRKIAAEYQEDIFRKKELEKISESSEITPGMKNILNSWLNALTVLDSAGVEDSGEKLKHEVEYCTTADEIENGGVFTSKKAANIFHEKLRSSCLSRKRWNDNDFENLTEEKKEEQHLDALKAGKYLSISKKILRSGESYLQASPFNNENGHFDLIFYPNKNLLLQNLARAKGTEERFITQIRREDNTEVEYVNKISPHVIEREKIINLIKRIENNEDDNDILENKK